MASSIPLQFAETLQTAHINRSPSPTHDLNPSTSASKKEPVILDDHPIHDEGIDDADHGNGGEDIPYSVLRPRRRSANLPPLPDLRFEQSYLHSIANADTWWKIVLITARDQIVMPLAQGLLYNLAICGWQTWNKNVRLSGNSVGAKVRRWWWGVNNWPIPGESIRSRIARSK
ncbi:hypothetical protein GE09DRAFT_1221314 [Coniochaeta sp. 2T2.1]|nr:hypothetical protein GE09DRAFT_1221314 [Coniochaeta sp. 2T2.1]